MTVVELWGDWAILIGPESQTPGEGELRRNSGQGVLRQALLECRKAYIKGTEPHTFKGSKTTHYALYHHKSETILRQLHTSG